MVKNFLPGVITTAKIINGKECGGYLKCISFFSIEDTENIIKKFEHTNIRYCGNSLYCWMKM